MSTGGNNTVSSDPDVLQLLIKFSVLTRLFERLLCVVFRALSRQSGVCCKETGGIEWFLFRHHSPVQI